MTIVIINPPGSVEKQQRVQQPRSAPYLGCLAVAGVVVDNKPGSWRISYVVFKGKLHGFVHGFVVGRTPWLMGCIGMCKL